MRQGLTTLDVLKHLGPGSQRGDGEEEGGAKKLRQQRSHVPAHLGVESLGQPTTYLTEVTPGAKKTTGPPLVRKLW